MASPNIDVLVYEDENGKEPFSEWIAGLDPAFRARIFARLDRLEKGNLGDWKMISEGLAELRFHFGPGFRVYFGRPDNALILLLAGGDKKTQKRDVKAAESLWLDYVRRTQQ